MCSYSVSLIVFLVTILLREMNILIGHFFAMNLIHLDEPNGIGLNLVVSCCLYDQGLSGVGGMLHDYSRLSRYGMPRKA